MRKKLILGLLALVLSSGIAVFGSPRGLVDKILDSVFEGFAATFTTDERRAWEVVAKSGHSKRSARKGQTSSKEVPESMLWHVTLDFTRKLGTKAEELNSQGNDGGLFSNYFVRQGPLSESSDKVLKEIATGYFEEIRPIEERAKSIMEASKSGSAPQGVSAQLEDLKSQKDTAALRNRDLVKSRLSDGEFTALVQFLKTDFSEGSVSGMMMPSGNAAKFSPQGIFYEGWSWIVWDDAQQPPLITGFSELYFYYFAPIAPYDPSLDSFFVNVTAQSLLSAGSSDGYRDWFPAQVFHPVFVSVRGNEYCTLTDFYAVLYDGPMIIDEVYLDSNGACHVVGAAPPTPSPTPTPNVASVTLSQVNPSTEPISVNPAVAPHNPGIGQRIFPDKDFANEDPNLIDRRLVRVTATLSQPIANVPVYFRNFDIDDPATDTTIDVNGAAGNDNRNDNTGVPNAGQLLQANGCGANGPSVFCPTDANGVATIVFTVSRQPGNNFAIAASINPIAVNGVTINGIELNDSGGQPVVTQNCPTQAICRSQMLTVWRRLHVEVDSMGQSTQNFVVGNSATFARVRRFGPDAVLDVNTSEPLEVNRFEGGRIVFGADQLRVVSNTATSVTVTNTLPAPNPVTVSVGEQFQLYDDDDFDDDNGNVLTGDTGEDILGPDQVLPTSGMSLLTGGSDVEATNVLAPAYVRPVYDITADTRDDCLFQANTPGLTPGDLRPLFRLCWDSGGSDADSAYWYSLVFGAYQHTLARDCDPSTDACTQGRVDVITDVTDDLEGSGALIFMEVHRTREVTGYNPNPDDVTSLANTVAHEIGHLFSCEHGELGLMGDANGQVLSSRFTAESIRRIRGLINP